jgi:glycosyltransferase involved in cell wall biosynthesis
MSRLPGADRPFAVILVHDFAAIKGGAERVAVGEAAGLARRGHRVTMIAGHGEPDPELLDAGVVVRLTGQHATIDAPSRARGATQGLWNLRSAQLVRDAAAGTNARSTIVHLHGLTKVMSPSVVRAAVRSRLPTVATLHDYFAACPNGGFFNYQTNEICHLTPLSRSCIATHCDARSYPHKLWRVARSEVQVHFGRMPAGVGAFIVPSRFAGDVLAPYLPGGAALHILPNPVHGERLPPADAAAGTAFVFIGRLERDKGPAVFAAAARAAGVRAVFVGEGAARESVTAANPEAEFTGWLDGAGVRSVISGARSVVNASLWYETQGLSVIEAASLGIPAVVSDSGAVRDAVLDGETGLWFTGGDADDLAAKLDRLNADSALAGRLGAAAYERFWSDPLDVESHLDRLEAIYREVLRR